MDDNSAALIQRVTSVMPIADELIKEGVLHGEKYDKFKAEENSQDEMRKLFESIKSEVDKIQKSAEKASTTTLRRPG